MDEQWYIGDLSPPRGPLARHTIESERQSGRIQAHTLVWREGMESWVQYNEAGLAAPSPPPLPPRRSQPPPLPPTPTAGDTAAHPVATKTSATTTSLQDGPVPAAWRGSDLENSATPPLPAVTDGGWTDVNPHPWRRFFARMIDTVIWGSLAALVWGYLASFADDLPNYFDPKNAESSSMVATLIIVGLGALLANAVLIGFTGTTIGKIIFGVRVTDAKGQAIGFQDALSREWDALYYGMGLNIPLVSLWRMFASCLQLTREGAVRYDVAKNWVVTHRPNGPLQWTLSTFGVFIFLTLVVSINALDQA